MQTLGLGREFMENVHVAFLSPSLESEDCMLEPDIKKSAGALFLCSAFFDLQATLDTRCLMTISHREGDRRSQRA